MEAVVRHTQLESQMQAAQHESLPAGGTGATSPAGLLQGPVGSVELPLLASRRLQQLNARLQAAHATWSAAKLEAERIETDAQLEEEAIGEPLQVLRPVADAAASIMVLVVDDQASPQRRVVYLTVDEVMTHVAGLASPLHRQRFELRNPALASLVASGKAALEAAVQSELRRLQVLFDDAADARSRAEDAHKRVAALSAEITALGGTPLLPGVTSATGETGTKASGSSTASANASGRLNAADCAELAVRHPATSAGTGFPLAEITSMAGFASGGAGSGLSSSASTGAGSALGSSASTEAGGGLSSSAATGGSAASVLTQRLWLRLDDFLVLLAPKFDGLSVSIDGTLPTRVAMTRPQLQSFIALLRRPGNEKQLQRLADLNAGVVDDLVSGERLNDDAYIDRLIDECTRREHITAAKAASAACISPAEEPGAALQAAKAGGLSSSVAAATLTAPAPGPASAFSSSSELLAALHAQIPAVSAFVTAGAGAIDAGMGGILRSQRDASVADAASPLDSASPAALTTLQHERMAPKAAGKSSTVVDSDAPLTGAKRRRSVDAAVGAPSASAEPIATVTDAMRDAAKRPRSASLGSSTSAAAWPLVAEEASVSVAATGASATSPAADESGSADRGDHVRPAESGKRCADGGDGGAANLADGADGGDRGVVHSAVEPGAGAVTAAGGLPLASTMPAVSTASVEANKLLASFLSDPSPAASYGVSARRLSVWVASNPSLAAVVTDLRLDIATCSAAEGRYIAAGLSMMPALQRLRIKCLDVARGVGCGEMFAALRGHNHIVSLKLSDLGVADNAMQSLAAALVEMPALEVLDLSCNRFGNDGVIELASALKLKPQPASLRTLSLLFNPKVGDAGLLALADALKVLTELRWLAVGAEGGEPTEAAFTDTGAAALARALQHVPRLDRFEILGDQMSTDTLIELCKGLQRLKQLKRLRVSSQRFGDWGLRHLLGSLSHLPELDWLCLASNGGTPACAASITAGLKSAPRLTRLDLSGNALSGDGEAALAVALRALPQLEELVLSDCELPATSAFLVALQGCVRLKRLDLSKCGLDATAMRKLIDCLHRLTSLRQVDLSGNDFTPKLARAFAAALPSLPHLRQLRLEDMAIPFAIPTPGRWYASIDKAVQALSLRCEVVVKRY